ncbi:hypothetical protein BJ322DRAFT_1145376 [Thelephora terrestris]|uniref:Uncharacterized protein n=1 Tax=Thelephora terrestris TaxID=56493 RepID=A0A9P6L3A9_9AGAM|nr:hypothetical protein BJ322DRAFT_1145376 [Thelephora terrestris]
MSAHSPPTKVGTVAKIKRIFFLSICLVSVAAQTNFAQCLETFRANGNATGGTDLFGNPVNNSKDAVGLTYEECTSLCGSGQQAFDWAVFSQQFSAWLLPWLALVSQLPFGADTPDNLISVILTVGSPTLAAFSLAITALNTKWANDRFSDIRYPNHKNAVKALICLQQVPLRLTTCGGLLASLIVLPENDDWWKCLAKSLRKTHTWTIPPVTLIAWVITSFLLTVINTFMNPGTNVDESGQGVGTLWLWLVPIVTGWLWIPVYPRDKLTAAIGKANRIAYPSNPSDVGDPIPSRVQHGHAIITCQKREVCTQDAVRVPPVFNYARLWEWSSNVETIALAFESAGRKAIGFETVSSGKRWVDAEGIHRDNRTGTVSQVQAYCGFRMEAVKEPTQPVPSGMWKRILVASVFALGLQWSTTGSAAIILLFTPTTGLGCRSAVYILYGLISTIIWLMLLSSSYLAHLAHCAKVRHSHEGRTRSGFNSANVAQGLAAFLRRSAVFLAVCNALCSILAGVFQFSNFFGTCYCDSSVLGRGAQYAYNLIDSSSYDYRNLTAVWAAAVVLAGVYVILFLFSLHVILEPWNNAMNR